MTRMISTILAATALLAATAAASQTAAPAAMTPAFKIPPGYLAGKPPVDILKLLPPPPALNSAQDIADRAVYAASAAGIDGPAWNEAVSELDPTSPAYFGKLSCAVGTIISPQTTPFTMALITRSGVDFSAPMSLAKNHYKRLRPFTTDAKLPGGGKACDPVTADGVGADLGYAYPSGHSGIGWLWAMILSDVAPTHAETIRAFGQHTGDLRLACRVHWLSDVAYGRVLATAVYDRVAADPAFKADLALAIAEVAAAPPLVCPKS